MSKYTYKVDPDPTRMGRYMFVIKRDGKPIAAMGDFESPRMAAQAAQDGLDMFLEAKRKIN